MLTGFHHMLIIISPSVTFLNAIQVRLATRGRFKHQPAALALEGMAVYKS